MGPILDHVVFYLQRHRDCQAKLEDQIKHKVELLAEIEEIKKKIDNFKKEVQVVQDKIEEYNHTISNYKKAIQELESKKEALLANDKELREEASLTIEKVNESKIQIAEVNKLTIERDCLSSKLAHSKAYLNTLKAEFEI